MKRRPNTIAVRLTQKNRRILKKYVGGAAQWAEGMLLSGSNAWGANHAVHQNSDIDLVITTKKIKEIGKIVENYISQGLLGQTERERFQIFARLSASKKADTFSVKHIHGTTSVGIDFILSGLVQKICGLQPLRKSISTGGALGVRTRTIYEFRSNPPKKDGYSLDEIAHGHTVRYFAKSRPVTGKDASIQGYLSASLVDGMAGRGAHRKYYLGVIAFFFSVKPKIYIDTEGFLEESIKKFQDEISKTLVGNAPRLITRQERMQKEILSQVKKELSGGGVPSF